MSMPYFLCVYVCIMLVGVCLSDCLYISVCLFQYIPQVFISCQYWLINNTGLPLIFRQDGASQEAAGQFEEHELARNLQPLLFSYTEPELPEKYVQIVDDCQ